MNMNQSTPHDHFFKWLLSDPGMVVEFLDQFLPKSLVAKVDNSTLKPVPVSFIDNKLEKLESDVLYQAKISEQLGYIYFLFEHQSQPDESMPLRSARYVLSIMERHRKVHKTRSLPFVFQTVFYNGQRAYPYSTDIRDMIDARPELTSQFRLGKFHLVDLNEIEREGERITTGFDLTMYAMKHAYAQDCAAAADFIIRQCEMMLSECQSEVALAQLLTIQEPLVRYIISAYKRLDKEKFMANLQASKAESLQDSGMTIADQLRLEGRQEGREEMRQETLQRVAEKMFRCGFSAEAIKEVTGMPLDHVTP